MTKLHFFHDWKIIAEKNVLLPCNRIYSENGAEYKINSDVYEVTGHYKKRFNIQIFRCWKCDKIKHIILDTRGYDHTKSLELWVAKELAGIVSESNNTTYHSKLEKDE
jgi:hypothetical protein